MTFEGRSSPSRTHAFVAELGLGAIAVVLTMVAGPLSVVADASGGAMPHLGARVSATPCTSSMVRETASTNEKTYGPGTAVTMTASIHNTSTQTCGIAIGPTSPALSVNNASGVEVWSSCSTGAATPCAMYLALEALAPGTTYTRTATWNQRSSAKVTRVPIGVYEFTSRLVDVTGQATATFKLTALTSPRTVTVTQADNGRRYSMTRGSRLIIELSGPTLYTWSEPVSSNPAALKRTSGSSLKPSVTTFTAEAVGNVRVTAIGNPTCYPECLMPSELFTIIVSVEK